MNIFLKAVYFANLAALLGGMAWITVRQEEGAFHSDSISVTFGEQIWKEAIVTLHGREDTRTLLFSYFNGEYRRNGTHDGRPLYTEQNKFDGNPFQGTVGAEIKYCDSEQAWVFAHKGIRKSRNNVEESDCPWLMRSAETTEYNLLELKGEWTVWTGSVQSNGQVRVMDNECQGAVDCNYFGRCSADGVCVCEEGYFGLHCEHKKPCSLITGGNGGTWSEVQWADEEMRIYQRPVYAYESGAPQALLDALNIDDMRDQIFLVYTGSRWLGTIYYGTKLAPVPREYWSNYVREWEEVYSNRTLFVSDPTTQSSILGVDMYQLGRQGEEYGDFGQLFPLSDPKGSGFLRCVEDEEVTYLWDANFLRASSDFSGDPGTVVVEYEVLRGRNYETEVLAGDCTTGANITFTKVPTISPDFETHDLLSLKYSLDKSQLWSSNLWDATTEQVAMCHRMMLVPSADDANLETILVEDFRLIAQQVPAPVERRQ